LEAQDDKGGLLGGHGTDDLAGGGHQSGRFAWTVSSTHGSGSDDGTVYAGPVNYLQHEYIWSGHDGRAVASGAANVFIHGGDGDDAISATKGSNVLDGGAGSNFLTGGRGDDGGTDTFFVDARGGQTVWDTIVNFHHGDAVTVWGFKPGISSIGWGENEGAVGARGATLHAEINGAGTGVNASVTFAGLSVAEAQARLGISSGNTGGSSYLYLHHNG
jgi:serralysin